MNKLPGLPLLETDRLILRQLEEGDRDSIFRLRTNEAVNRFLDRDPPTRPEDAEAFIKKIKAGIDGNDSYYWAISRKEEPGLVGTMCIWNISVDRKKGEIGYELLPDMQGKGLMQEAIGRLIRFAFDVIGLELLEAYTHKENEASTRLLLKFGFKPDPNKNDPENPHLVIYSLENVDPASR
jgi:[ribosomal protein S5]-alanine N-acetyltransferase